MKPKEKKVTDCEFNTSKVKNALFTGVYLWPFKLNGFIEFYECTGVKGAVKSIFASPGDIFCHVLLPIYVSRFSNNQILTDGPK